MEIIITPWFNVKNYGGRGQGVGNREFWYTSSKFYSDNT